MMILCDPIQPKSIVLPCLASVEANNAKLARLGKLITQFYSVGYADVRSHKLLCSHAGWCKQDSCAAKVGAIANLTQKNEIDVLKLELFHPRANS
eukprot:1139168-Pelagomonas_calceolata.AAC.6